MIHRPPTETIDRKPMSFQVGDDYSSVHCCSMHRREIVRSISHCSHRMRCSVAPGRAPNHRAGAHVRRPPTKIFHSLPCACTAITDMSLKDASVYRCSMLLRGMCMISLKCMRYFFLFCLSCLFYLLLCFCLIGERTCSLNEVFYCNIPQCCKQTNKIFLRFGIKAYCSQNGTHYCIAQELFTSKPRRNSRVV